MDRLSRGEHPMGYGIYHGIGHTISNGNCSFMGSPSHGMPMGYNLIPKGYNGILMGATMEPPVGNSMENPIGSPMECSTTPYDIPW